MRPRAIKVHLLGAAVLTVLAILAGCQSVDTRPVSTTPPPAPTLAANLPALIVTACLDRTPSFSRSYFDAGKDLLADAILARASAGGQMGATIYVTLIGHNSYATSSTVRTIVMPPTPYNSNSALPSPTTNPNIYEAPTATAAARQTAAAGAAAATAAASQTSQVVQQLQPDIAFLRGLNPPTDSPTDILGCVSRASERFQAAPSGTQKLLILVTDLQKAGTQQDSKSRPLTGVTVKAIEWECDDAQACDVAKSQWHDEFVTKDQARNVTYYDPSETQAQLTGHLFDVNP